MERVAGAPLRIFRTPDDIGEHVASRILRGIRSTRGDGCRFLLGLPTGRTPRPVYRAMAAQLKAEPQSLAHVTLVMMDEYLVETPDGIGYVTSPGGPSCHAFTRDEIVGPLNAVLAPSLALRDEMVWFPDPRDPGEYDRRIEDAGGIDLFLVASGSGDGHVAFNPIGSSMTSVSRIVELSEQTRRDNLETFPDLGSLDRVPRLGVTVGVATIMAAREVVMVAWGEGKRETVRRMRTAREYDPAWPATLIHACASGEICVDEAAAGDPG